MAPTIFWATGFEQGANPSDLVNTGGLFTAIANGAQITTVTTPVRSGTYALRVNSNAVTTNLVNAAAFSGNHAIDSCYFRFDTLPGQQCTILGVSGVTGSDSGLLYDFASGQMRMRFGSSGGVVGGPVIQTGRWYLWDWRVIFDDGSGVKKMDAILTEDDGTRHIFDQVTLSEAATTWQLVRFGAPSAVTFDCYYDDRAVSETLGDYPIGPHRVIAALPNGDGTHSGITAGDFTDEAGTNIVVGTTTAWQNVSTVPWQTANRIEQRVLRTAAYVEILFATPVVNANEMVWDIFAQLGYHAAGTQSATGATYASMDDFGSSTTVYGSSGAPADMSETALFTKWVKMPRPAAGWNATNYDDLEMRIGHSGDATPDVYWDALMFEVVVGPTSPPAFVQNHGRFLGSRDFEPWSLDGWR